MKINNDDLIYYDIDQLEADKNKNIAKKNDLDKNVFLRLLTTQLSNQDPLNPMEDKEFIAQMAQFSSLEQMQNLNKIFLETRKELFISLENLNLNQMEANVRIIEELANIRKAIESYTGKDIIDDPEKIEGES